MLKVVAAARRRPGMTHEEYIRYVQHVHGALARARPLGLARYVQNHVFDSAFGSDASNTHTGVFHRDSVTELYFPTPADLQRTFADEYTRTVIGPDGQNFAELATTLTLVTEETSVVNQTGGDIKIMHFLFASEVSSGHEPAARWLEAHQKALVAVPDFAGTLKGLTRSDVRDAGPEAGRLVAHFGAAQGHCVLMISYWVSQGGRASFRDYERSLMSCSGLDPRSSFFLFASEVVII